MGLRFAPILSPIHFSPLPQQDTGNGFRVRKPKHLGSFVKGAQDSPEVTFRKRCYKCDLMGTLFPLVLGPC